MSQAKHQMTINPQNIVNNSKLLIGKYFAQKQVENWPLRILNDNGKFNYEVDYKGSENIVYPEEVSSMILVKMKEIAEAYLAKKVNDAVITVPAYFNDSQRRATMDAGRIAGLNILQIINDSSAASIAYHFDKKEKEQHNILIFDLGGGSLDVSVINIEEGIHDVKSIAGTNLGGEDFNDRLVKYFSDEFIGKYKKDFTSNKKAMARLRDACENLKRALSTNIRAVIEIDSFFENIDFYHQITRELFEAICSDLFAETLNIVENVLKDANLDSTEIQEVVLVGGSTRIPKIQEMLKNYFKGKELNKSVNADEAVACGAAIR
jgi:heat shock 70kDa protein 1/2/6/8